MGVNERIEFKKNLSFGFAHGLMRIYSEKVIRDSVSPKPEMSSMQLEPLPLPTILCHDTVQEKLLEINLGVKNSILPRSVIR